MWVDILAACRRVGGKFTDDLLKNIVEGDQSLNITILIDHHSNSTALLLEIEQLDVERCPFGNEVGLPG